AVALLEAGEDEVRRLDVAGTDHVVELVAISGEVVDIARQEVAALPIQEIQVALIDLLGHLAVDRGAAVVRLFENPAYLARGRPLGVRGGDGARRQYRGIRRRLDRPRQREREDCQD